MSSEEDRARALLYEMQTRLAAGPHAALGVPTHATASDVRQAFLGLTKQFHPAKFARMSNGTQKLSNEIFLSLKAAHEMLAKPKPPPSRSQTPSSAPPIRPPTRPFGVPVQPTTPPQGTRPSTPAMPQRTPPAAVTPASRISTPAMPGRSQSPSSPAPNRQSTPVMPQGRPASTTPPSGIRIGGGPTPPRPGSGQSQPLRPLTGQSQPMPKVGSSSTGEVLDPALAPILEMMGRGDWDRAQHAIDQLAMKNPQSNRYQAMSSYCRGKRAMNERRFDDARVELQTALMQDNTLDLAKSAITELMIAARRR